MIGKAVAQQTAKKAPPSVPTVMKTRKKSAAQLDREIAQALAERAYFKIGDVVLMGKYKNKRGVIVGFGQDQWGNPTVEVEPVPKGRKQNRIIGLYKIWRADVKEGVLKKESPQRTKKRRGAA